MREVKLKNVGKTAINITVPTIIEGTGQIFSHIEPCQIGEVRVMDGDNPSIKIFARGGLLAPTDPVSKAWFAELPPAAAKK